MSDGPYDYARERWDAMNASRIATRIIGGVEYDEDDLPSKSDLAYDAELGDQRPSNASGMRSALRRASVAHSILSERTCATSTPDTSATTAASSCPPWCSTRRCDQ